MVGSIASNNNGVASLSKINCDIVAMLIIIIITIKIIKGNGTTITTFIWISNGPKS